MTIIERYKSAGELPDLIVIDEGGEVMIGFDGYAWHTHGEILDAWGYQGSPAEATRRFVDDILASRRQIIVWRLNGRIRNLAVPVEQKIDRREVAEHIRKYGSPGETAEIRYWNGQRSAVL